MSKAEIKKKLRDAKRTLNRPNLSATQQIELERRLKALEIELKQLELQEVDARMIQKYKYIKFVEQKKVKRRMKKIEKAIQQIESDQKEQDQILNSFAEEPITFQNIMRTEELEHEELVSMDIKELSRLYHIEKLKLCYIQYFPLDGKYISLFVTPASSTLVNEILLSDSENKEKEDSKSNHTMVKSKKSVKISQNIQILILKQVQEAVKSGAIKNKNFSLHMKDIFYQKEYFKDQNEKSTTKTNRDIGRKQESKEKQQGRNMTFGNEHQHSKDFNDYDHKNIQEMNINDEVDDFFN